MMQNTLDGSPRRMRRARAIHVLYAAMIGAALCAAGCSVGAGGASPSGPQGGGATGSTAPSNPSPSSAPTAGNYVATVLSDTPLAYYRLAEKNGTVAVDSSGNGHNGTYVGKVALNQAALVPGDPGASSASFATGYVTEQATWKNPAVTAECWIRPTAHDIATNPRIIDNAWTDHDGQGFMLWIDSDTAAFNTGWLTTVGTGPLRAGQTYYVAGTYSATSGATLYIDGLAVANAKPGALPSPQKGDSSTTYIGVLNATAGGFGINDFFQGDVSDCALYDHVLPPARIAAHYESGAQTHIGPPPSPSPTPTSSSSPPPTPTPSPIAYGPTRACINGNVYTNNVLPKGQGEFQAGFDTKWWGRERGNDIGGNHYSGFQTSWGRNQYDTWWSDPSDGLGLPFPIAYAQDTGSSGSPWGVRITANPLPASLAGSSRVGGAHWYAGVIDTPVKLEYGFFVARLRLPPPDPGMSPAFWMLTNNGTPQGPHGPLNGEWDVQEMFGNDLGNGMNSGTSLWNSGSNTPQNWGGTYAWPNSEQGTPSTSYHDYGALIRPGGARISPNYYGPGGPGYVYGTAGTGVTDYLDGVPLYGHTGGADVTSGVAWKELMAMFQVGPAGGWLGTPVPSDFPATYWVQWIRIYRDTGTRC